MYYIAPIVGTTRGTGVYTVYCIKTQYDSDFWAPVNNLEYSMLEAAISARG